MTTGPLISIIIPVFNVEDYLERCLNSLINQSYKNIEIILVNDGSTDNSGIICDKYVKKDSRIKVNHIKNGGSSIARNTGLKMAKGAFIGFVDSDDWVMPDLFSTLLSFAIDKDLSVVECSSVESIALKNHNYSDNSKFGIIESKHDTLIRVIKNKRFAVWRRIYKADLLKDRYFKKHILHQDVYYTMDVLNEVDKIGFIDKPLYIYNVENENSVIRSKYSLKKLNSIGAGEYVVLATVNESEEIQCSAKQYFFQFLTSHYNHLFANNALDKNFIHRNKIRKQLTKHHSLKCFNFFAFIIILLPKSIYKYFLVVNKKRIQFQNTLNLNIKDV